MSLNIPFQDQMLYAQLAVAESIIDYIREVLESGDFADEELLVQLGMAYFSIRAAQEKMKFLLNKPKDTCRGCH